MKLKCDNCKHGRGFPCQTAADKTLAGREPIPGACYLITDEWDECAGYERRWWKFWAARRGGK